jgi:hypothetical protein
MNGFKRRTLTGPAEGGFVNQNVLARARRRMCASPEAVAHPVGPLPEPAVAWIGRLRSRGQTHLFYPVSRLQREFRLGYVRACALADLLAHRGEWTIRFSTDGTRYARIRSGEAV